MKSLTPSQLKALVDSTGSHFFDRDSMKFFGDTMKNYGVRQVVVDMEGWTSPEVVYELYRKRPVKHGNQSSAFFTKEGKIVRGFHNLVILEYVK